VHEDKTMRDIATYIDAASQVIQDLLGVQPKTFAYPCGQSFIGRASQRRSYVPLVTERFVASRGGFVACLIAVPWSRFASRGHTG
jgi:peptidoglycan-N-acetylglucosamine deacetylase